MRQIALLLSFVLLPVTPVTAASGTTLTAEASASLSAGVSSLQNEEASQQREEERESRSDLLPLSGTGTVTRREQGADPFLIVAVEGLDTSFRDVPREAWFAPFVRDILERGWMSGYRDDNGELLGQFGPGDSVTLEQLAKVAVEMSGRDASSCAAEAGPLLAKSAAGTWAEPYVRCAESLGWAVYSDGGESLRSPALRREVVVTILQAFGVEASPATGKVFTDVAANIPFASFIERAAADGVVGGYTDTSGNLTGRFGPSDAVNRAALAKILLTASAKYGS